MTKLDRLVRRWSCKPWCQRAFTSSKAKGSGGPGGCGAAAECDCRGAARKRHLPTSLQASPSLDRKLTFSLAARARDAQSAEETKSGVGWSSAPTGVLPSCEAFSRS